MKKELTENGCGGLCQLTDFDAWLPAVLEGSITCFVCWIYYAWVEMPQNWPFPLEMTGFPDESLTGPSC